MSKLRQIRNCPLPLHKTLLSLWQKKLKLLETNFYKIIENILKKLKIMVSGQ